MFALLLSMQLLISTNIATAPSIAGSAAQAMDFIKEDIKPVIKYSMDWAIQAAMAATSVHAFIVLCKRFID